MQTSDGNGSVERWNTVEELCDRYLGGRPSKPVLRLLKHAEQQRPAVRDFVERGFRLMALSKFDPRDLSTGVARFFAVLAPSILPDMWGMVPPITMPGRHKKIDAYLRSNPWASFDPRTVLLDLGCGFPPQTSMDAADAFPEWQIVGVDPAFYPYLIYDKADNYASFDSNGTLRYFQASRPEEFVGLYSDRNATIRRFSEGFARLLPSLPADDLNLCTTEQEGMRLLRNPLRTYERSNLKLVQGGFGSNNLPKARIVRSFNVLIYFDADFRRQAEEWVTQVLQPGGLFVCGRDDAATLNAYYRIYRKEDGHLIEKEFAFGVETVRYCTWFTLHDGEQETWRLAELLGILRSDRAFLSDYDARMDALLAENGIAVRDAKGYLADPPGPIDMARVFRVYEEIAGRLTAEFVDHAVSVLQGAGLNAWRNSAGHVAVAPMAGTGPVQ